MKLNTLLKEANVSSYGFPAFKGLAEKSNKDGYAANVSTLTPGLMLDQGIRTYYAPVIPRNTIFNSAEDVISADLDVVETTVSAAEPILPTEQVVIASRHPGTVELLKQKFPNNVVLDSVTPGDIAGKKVVGTLPATLIQYAQSFQAVAIKDFDNRKDKDIDGAELEERTIIAPPITVTVKA